MVPPCFTPAATAACQPVGITSESATRCGTSAASGPEAPTSGTFTRLPSAWPTRAYWPCPELVIDSSTQADCMPARQCAQVLSQWSKGTTTKSPGRTSLTSGPTSSTTPMHSCPMVSPGVMSFSPR